MQHTPATARAADPAPDPAQQMPLLRHLVVGILHINSETAGADPHVPFGGSRHSGFGPREQGRAARDFFTTTTTVSIRGSRTVIR
ncbi:aldehyde dehydrogenase family protein [Streptomyces atratus]|uniref:aldehyde dehydrogenase family protein n=1 Tax=Streptomyces atratus TaxID=1893 RepID=UPI00225372D5|nr:aldehyde dehydrogenase family protein [Streptomyces atratus]MCX5339522.1 aldehyde dehydrogenase family protein [Streptomyces atratus]